ncbi:MAG TPA: asparagine synthase (glutamine-hydrolyzing) [Ignavibacteria bacterium]|nr:asparagine synthase (glutamine-hydrolyzing) [Ignavibacteria bacterium]
MCGINGILYLNNFNSSENESFHRSNIIKMNDAISHRGPDGDGVYINYPVSFGHRRLSIIDLSDNGSQPMFNEDSSVVLTYNGEIYNYRELIPDLLNKGHKFRSESDSEVILHSYEEYGIDCVNNFNGMWAFAIYDFKKNIFFASRDRFGVKPFYYYKNENEFIFSSEIKAILKVKNITDADRIKVYEYLAYGYRTTDGRTFFKDINELPPGTNLVISNSDFNFHKYWSFSETEDKIADAHDRLRELLYDSVRIRFRSDVPVSILLSGGMDSGIIAKITDELINSGDIPNSSVSAFSAVFPGYEFDESKEIDEILSCSRNLTGYKITPSGNDLTENLNDFIYGMGEPVFSTSSFAHYRLMQDIHKKDVKVVLNGQGSDEAWCGYGKYIAGYFLLDRLLSEPSDFFRQMSSISDKLKMTYTGLILQTIKAMTGRRKVSMIRSKKIEKTREVISDELYNESYLNFPDIKFNKSGGKNLSSYMKNNITFQGFGQILHYEDHSAMQSSVEIRSPFIDYRIMELAFSVGDKIKFDEGVTKKILRELFSQKLPSSITGNHRKIGFMTPFDVWLSEPKTVKTVFEILNSPSFNSKNIWKPDKINDIFKDKINYQSFPFWRFLNLEIWSQVYNIKNL